MDLKFVLIYVRVRTVLYVTTTRPYLFNLMEWLMFELFIDCMVDDTYVLYVLCQENPSYHSITSLAAYKVPYNEYLVEISGSPACSRDYLYWFELAVLGNI
jgi:hypothetical protein